MHRCGHPHAEEAFAVQGFDDRLGQPSFLVSELRVLIGNARDFFGPFLEIC
jgi:hypothetical protein